MQFLLTTRVLCNWKRSLFLSDALMERIFTSLIKFEYFFLKKGGTSQAQGSQHWATIGANNSVHEKMEVWNEALIDF